MPETELSLMFSFEILGEIRSEKDSANWLGYFNSDMVIGLWLIPFDTDAFLLSWSILEKWTCEPKAFSFQCMTKFTTNKKLKKKNSKDS